MRVLDGPADLSVGEDAEAAVENVLDEEVGRELVTGGRRVAHHRVEGVQGAAVELDPHADHARVVGHGDESDLGGDHGRVQLVDVLDVSVGVAVEDLEEKTR